MSDLVCAFEADLNLKGYGSFQRRQLFFIPIICDVFINEMKTKLIIVLSHDIREEIAKPFQHLLNQLDFLDNVTPVLVRAFEWSKWDYRIKTELLNHLETLAPVYEGEATMDIVSKARAITRFKDLISKESTL